MERALLEGSASWKGTTFTLAGDGGGCTRAVCSDEEGRLAGRGGPAEAASSESSPVRADINQSIAYVRALEVVRAAGIRHRGCVPFVSAGEVPRGGLVLQLCDRLHAPPRPSAGPAFHHLCSRRLVRFVFQGLLIAAHLPGKHTRKRGAHQDLCDLPEE